MGQVRDVRFKLDVASKELVVINTPKRLIITSGDTSDVDGFLALAAYSKVSDVQIICNLVHACVQAPNVLNALLLFHPDGG